MTKRPDHSESGPIDISYGQQWFGDLPDLYVAAEQCGIKINSDINNGDPIGLGMGPVSIFRDVRGTASSIFLSNAPSNLSVITNALVEKVVFQDKRAIGVKVVDGRTFRAKNEVIISGGALNSPQILLLSGVGPEEELQKHEIRVVQDLPTLGRTLQDHVVSSVGIIFKKSSEEQPEPVQQTPSPMGFFQDAAIYKSPEYKALDPKLRQFMALPTVPQFELIAVSGRPRQRTDVYS